MFWEWEEIKMRYLFCELRKNNVSTTPEVYIFIMISSLIIPIT